LDDNDYVVRFDMDNENYYAWYDSDGNWIGSAYAVNDQSTLPSAVSNLLTTQYSGYTIEKVQKEMWKDRMAYEIKLKNENDSKVKLLVDGNGNILKEKNKE
ncbi:MAG TPA: PepSY-like domain-containing protein, partial [Flavisolibacter sp.]|nr:PepSY-like domain-containing protein [Flavisolibacter sp.]